MARAAAVAPETLLLCRTLVNLQLLARQLTPVMHDHREQLINQAMHAADSAAAVATAVDANGDTAVDDDAVADVALATADGVAASAEAAAHTADAEPFDTDAAPASGAVTAACTPATAAAADAAVPAPQSVSSPFAILEDPVIPGSVIPSVPGVAFEWQGRRHEQSGSLPLDQMLSRNPSPIASLPSQILESHHSDSVSRQSSMLPSRLGSVDNVRELLAPMQGQPSSMVTAASGQLPQDDNSPPETHGSSAAATSATFETAAQPHRGLATVYSGQRLPMDLTQSRGHALPFRTHDSASDQSNSADATPSARDSEPQPSSSGPGRRTLLVAADEGAGRVAKEAGVLEDASQNDSSAASVQSHDDDLVAQLEFEAEARRQETRRQHPWLLYFYDREMEKNYSQYHARQMLKVCLNHTNERMLFPMLTLGTAMHVSRSSNALVDIVKFQARLQADIINQTLEHTLEQVTEYIVCVAGGCSEFDDLCGDLPAFRVCQQPCIRLSGAGDFWHHPESDAGLCVQHAVHARQVCLDCYFHCVGFVLVSRQNDRQ